MKRFSTVIATALFVCAIITATASAKVKSRVISIGQDFTVAGTTIKAGTYRFSFDDQKNELTVIDRKTKEVLARAEARAEDRQGGDPLPAGVHLVGDAAPRTIAGITFDDKQIVRITGATAQGR
jgi:hypothetical protein